MPLSATPTMKRLHDDRIRFRLIAPQVDHGKHPVKRLLGDLLTVRATIFRDGTEHLGAAVRYWHDSDREQQQILMKPLGNDLWEASFPVTSLGLYHFGIAAWTDLLASWQEKLIKKWDAGEKELANEFLEGAALLRTLTERAPRGDARVPLIKTAMLLADPSQPLEQTVRMATAPELAKIGARYPDPAMLATFEQTFQVVVDPRRAGCAAWYELFPRSQSLEPGKHGTFRDVLRRLPELRDLGFDVVYFPPIHPIGMTNRKGKNNAVEAQPGDVGSPWAIGNWQGGHDAIEPALGTLDDFRMLVGAAQAHGMEIALDFAINCSPDHPWVQQCPHWFKRRPDGTIAFAENPPKKYQDIYPVDFDCRDWPALWQELLRVLRYWIAQGVKTFRVDNPHTKPIGMWEWLISTIKKGHPEVVFLSEAFTRPGMMKELAKIGFSQSYTYFTWRNTKDEITEYLTELASTEMMEYFRPHFFVNTPDILHAYLQTGGKTAFAVRLFLAATLSPLYGIYSGFEFYENKPLHKGSEEYFDSEKYELKQRPTDMPGSLKPLIKLLNHTRRSHPALQQLGNVVFHKITNSQLLCYSKSTKDLTDNLIFVVNLNPTQPQDGIIELDLQRLGLQEGQVFFVHDVLTNQTFSWRGSKNYIRLDPQTAPAHLLVVCVPVFKDIPMQEPAATTQTLSEASDATIDTDTDISVQEVSDAKGTRSDAPAPISQSQ